MGSDERHFSVSLIVMEKATRQCPQTTTFWRERRADAESNRSPSASQPDALPLGQTGSHAGKNTKATLNCCDAMHYSCAVETIFSRDKLLVQRYPSSRCEDKSSEMEKERGGGGGEGAGGKYTQSSQHTECINQCSVAYILVLLCPLREIRVTLPG